MILLFGTGRKPSLFSKMMLPAKECGLDFISKPPSGCQDRPRRSYCFLVMSAFRRSYHLTPVLTILAIRASKTQYHLLIILHLMTYSTLGLDLSAKT